MAASAEQIKTPEALIDPADRAQFAAHVRIFPEETIRGDASTRTGAVLLAFDAKAHPSLVGRDFADEIEATLGLKAETDGVFVPLSWVNDGIMLDPTPKDEVGRLRISKMHNDEMLGEIGGYYGIRLSNDEGIQSLGVRDTAAIAAIIAERYDDETLRILYNYTNNDAEPIEITGNDGYNLASQTTGDHPEIPIEEILKSREVRVEHLAPKFAQVAFA